MRSAWRAKLGVRLRFPCLESSQPGQLPQRTMSSTPDQDTPEAVSPAVEPVDENIAISRAGHRGREPHGPIATSCSTGPPPPDAHTAASDAACCSMPVVCRHRSAGGKKKKLCSQLHHTTAFRAAPGVDPPRKVVLEVPPLPEGATVEESKAACRPSKPCARAGSPGVRPAALKRATPAAAAGRVHQARHDGLQPDWAGPLVKFSTMHSKATWWPKR